MLLDTSTLLWALDDSPRLGRRSRALISSGQRVHVSAVSVAEIAIKAMLGKLAAPDDIAFEISEAGFVTIPFAVDDAEGMRAFPELIRHDPFDRMLVAQAHVRGLDFLTADRRLLALGRTNILDATA